METPAFSLMFCLFHILISGKSGCPHNQWHFFTWHAFLSLKYNSRNINSLLLNVNSVVSWGFFLFFFMFFVCLFVCFGCLWGVLAVPYNLRDPSFPDQGLNPLPQRWKPRVLTTGLSGNSLVGFTIFTKLYNHYHSNSRTFLSTSSKKNNLYPLVLIPQFPSLQPLTATDAFCLWICLFWTLHVNAVI